jgi:hypothetical protein
MFKFAANCAMLPMRFCAYVMRLCVQAFLYLRRQQKALAVKTKPAVAKAQYVGMAFTNR